MVRLSAPIADSERDDRGQLEVDEGRETHDDALERLVLKQNEVSTAMEK